MTRQYSLAVLMALVMCSGCRVGPTYKIPAAPLPDAYKEIATTEPGSGWEVARPADQIPRGAWWTVFADSTLNGLEPQVAKANQSLKVAEARYRQARSQITFERANLSPTVRTTPLVAGERLSSNRPYPSAAPNDNVADIAVPVSLDYEIDFWGRVRRSIDAARYETVATAADMQSALLSLQSELATDYFELRSADATARILSEAVQRYGEAVDITRHRFDEGLAPQSDLDQAETQLEAAHVQLVDTTMRRAQYEHAIAVLIGQPPASFHLEAKAWEVHLPNTPVDVPAVLLQRRPDIASAERRMAEANERIGIAQAAFYPTISLSALAGVESTAAGRLLNASSFLWGVGPTASQTLFDAGRRRSLVEQAGANYDETVAAYRQNVLSAFQQVEDNLAALTHLQEEATRQQHATHAAEAARDIFQNRYVGGLDPYLSVIVAQTIALDNQKNDVDIRRRQLEASVLLIRALGGGWSVADLPKL